MRYFKLSKSSIAAFEQCPKRAWLQYYKHEPNTINPSSAIRIASGEEVGMAARALHPAGILIEAKPEMQAALLSTSTAMNDINASVLFEATFEHEGVLVRVDILQRDGNGGWRVAEVKSSTSRKDYHLSDLATQIWVLLKNGVLISGAAIRHINNQFLLKETNEYQGLFTDASSMDDIAALIGNRSEIVAEAKRVLSGSEPDNEMGDHCQKPFSCEFQDYCSQGAASPEWPISLLPGNVAALVTQWSAKGITDLTKVPSGDLTNPLHARVHHATCTGEVYHDAEGARQATKGWVYPRTYLDFETIAFPVPRWIGTKPYQQLPFQFSAHVEQADGSIEHREFLSLNGEDPRRACAEALIADIPSNGAVIAYFASFERARILELADSFPDLSEGLAQIATRIVDLLPVTRNHWYHRDQRGSWSIKAVLPTVSDDLSYKNLAVGDGTAAQLAYLEAIRPDATDERRDEIDRELRVYCGQDTKAMVVLLHKLTTDSTG